MNMLKSPYVNVVDMDSRMASLFDTIEMLAREVLVELKTHARAYCLIVSAMKLCR